MLDRELVEAAAREEQLLAHGTRPEEQWGGTAFLKGTEASE